MLSTILVTVSLAVTPISAGLSLKDVPGHTTTADVPGDEDDALDMWNWMDAEGAERVFRPKRKHLVTPPARSSFVWVKEVNRRWFVPEPVLRRHDIKPGETISLEKAREIAVGMGYKYTPEDLERLRQIDQGD
jgi:hypothetical protein